MGTSLFAAGGGTNAKWRSSAAAIIDALSYKMRQGNKMGDSPDSVAFESVSSPSTIPPKRQNRVFCAFNYRMDRIPGHRSLLLSLIPSSINTYT
jgi:hypothetical protein